MALPRNSATLVPRSAGGQTRPIRGLESGLPTVVGVVEAHLKIKSCDMDTSAGPSPGKPAPGSAEHGEMALKTPRRSAKKCQKFRLCGVLRENRLELICAGLAGTTVAGEIGPSEPMVER